MFTGLVSATGRVVQAQPGRLGIESDLTAGALSIGASVAVNGACLTVVDLAGSRFSVDVVPETLRRTNLGGLEAGSPVNLELPLRLDGGLDGHLVLGHVDATARVLQLEAAALGKEVQIELPPALAPFIAEKGFVAVDGASLTVASVDAGCFGIALIPRTLAATIAGEYAPGTLVNLEADVMARYVHRILTETRSGTGI